MSGLKDRLIRLIEAGGPISVSDYMNACLHDPQEGYYATRPGLGRDFRTAPETSQIFGELLGLWAAHEWQAMGSPPRFSLVEIGPGRGALISDALRAAKTVPGFLDAMTLILIEPSPVLRSRLTETLAERRPVFLDRPDQVPCDQPVLLLANEWLDCLPVRQYEQDAGAWHERIVCSDGQGELKLGLAQDTAPDLSAYAANGSVLEIQPGLETLVTWLRDMFARTPGRALFIDYGPDDHAPGDTLRAYSNGEQVDPLARPGECDLTVDVDFGYLSRRGQHVGLSVAGPKTQGTFLLALGAEARLNQIARSNPASADAVYQGVRKLIDPSEMGHRFKALCLSSQGLGVPAGF